MESTDLELETRQKSFFYIFVQFVQFYGHYSQYSIMKCEVI